MVTPCVHKGYIDEAPPASCHCNFSVWEYTEDRLDLESLQEAARSCSWNSHMGTNVGNERGEILMSVVTDLEGLLALKPMADGLMKRFC